MCLGVTPNCTQILSMQVCHIAEVQGWPAKIKEGTTVIINFWKTDQPVISSIPYAPTVAICFSSERLLIIRRQAPVLCLRFLTCQAGITKLSCLKIEYNYGCKCLSKHKLVMISFKYVTAMTFLTTNVKMAQNLDPNLSIFLEICWHVSFRNGFVGGGLLYVQVEILSVTYIYARPMWVSKFKKILWHSKISMAQT